MSRVRTALAVAIASAALAFPSAASATTPPNDQPPATDDSSSNVDQPVTTNEFLDLERNLSECISAMPRPGCGREPTSSGDRGGWQQLLLFGVLMTGMAGIGTRVFFAVRKRDRSESPQPSSSS